MLRFLLWLLGGLFVVAAVVFIAFQVSPRPGALLIAQAFNHPVTIKDEEKYQRSENNVEVVNDLTYQSSFDKSTFDIYYPKTEKKYPVLFWVHGGGYVGGDKSGMKEFATYIANDAEIAVIALNYELAPALHYPGQIQQLDQAFQSIKSNSDEYPMLDFDQVFFGGDSAGAQIAGQYTALQTNLTYAKELKITPVIAPAAIKGFISYCGPLDLKQVAEESTDNRMMKFFVKTVAWSLLGKKDWKDSLELQQASLVDKLTKDFPATYVTDGNAYSFSNEGQAFVDRLEELQVPVTGLFYDDTNKQVTHEYQFDYTTPEAKDCYEETLNFVKIALEK